MLLIYMNSEDKYRPKDENGCISKELESAIEGLGRDSIGTVKKRFSEVRADSFNNMRSLDWETRSERSLQSQESEEASAEENLKFRSSALTQSLRGDITMELF